MATRSGARSPPPRAQSDRARVSEWVGGGGGVVVWWCLWVLRRVLLPQNSGRGCWCWCGRTAIVLCRQTADAPSQRKALSSYGAIASERADPRLPQRCGGGVRRRHSAHQATPDASNHNECATAPHPPLHSQTRSRDRIHVACTQPSVGGCCWCQLHPHRPGMGRGEACVCGGEQDDNRRREDKHVNIRLVKAISHAE
jgi:hypothetical protein